MSHRSLVLLLLTLGIGGCATTIRPPASLCDPVVVVLVNYGKHASLVLPASGGSTEFAYGHWGYFALNENDLCTGMFALCCYSQGTLGQRSFDVAPCRAGLHGRISAESLTELKVERAKAEELRAKLEARWERYAETKAANSLNGLTFVKDDESYMCWNNCNHVVLRWLEALGCETSGCGCFADFKIVTPEE